MFWSDAVQSELDLAGVVVGKCYYLSMACFHGNLSFDDLELFTKLDSILSVNILSDSCLEVKGTNKNVKTD